MCKFSKLAYSVDRHACLCLCITSMQIELVVALVHLVSTHKSIIG